MHGATLAAADAISATVNLSHHGMHVAAFADRMTVATVIGGNLVTLIQMHAEPGRAGFLAGIEVNKARNFAGGEFHVQTFLKLTDSFHHPVCFEKFIFAEWHT